MRQKNQALCWNNSAKFLRLLMLLKNFAKTMGFPHKTPAQVPYFKMRSGYKLAKTSLPAVRFLQHCQLPPRTVSIYTSYKSCNQHKPVFCSLLFIFMLIIVEHIGDAI